MTGFATRILNTCSRDIVILELERDAMVHLRDKHAKMGVAIRIKSSSVTSS